MPISGFHFSDENEKKGNEKTSSSKSAPIAARTSAMHDLIDMPGDRELSLFFINGSGRFWQPPCIIQVMCNKYIAVYIVY